MARQIADYVALVLIANFRREDPFADEDFNSFYTSRAEDFSGDFKELKAYTVKRCGFSFRDDLLREAVRSLSDCNLVRVTDDPYSGTFYKIRASGFPSFVERARNEISSVLNDGGNDDAILSMRSDYPNAWALMSHQVIEDYSELGDSWFSRAIEGLAKQAEAGELPAEAGAPISPTDPIVPAADRVVTLQDNQQAEIEVASTEIIEALERENSIDGDLSLRDRFIGQLKAGRELVRAKTLSAYLLYQTVFEVLSALITRYKGHAIEAVAKRLLDLLIDRVFGK
jgi:hypothetical protein